MQHLGVLLAIALTTLLVAPAAAVTVAVASALTCLLAARAPILMGTATRTAGNLKSRLVMNHFFIVSRPLF